VETQTTPIAAGHVLHGPLFSEPMRVETVQANGAASFAWSPDGSRVAFYDGNVFTVEVADGSLRQWTYDSPYCHWPTWSPDGRYILYSVTGRAAFAPDSTAGFHVIDTWDGSQRAFVHDSVLAHALVGGLAHWSPDGASISFFTTLHPNSGGSPPYHSDLIVMAVDGVTWRRVITVGGIAENPQWSADGRMLFFDLTPSPLLPADTDATTTWVVNADGTGLRQWPVNLGDPRVQFAFPFQLDRTGQRVAYVGLDSTGKRGVIWTMNLDGTHRHQVTRP